LIASNIDLEYLEARHELSYWLTQLRGDRQREVLVWTYDGATPVEIAAELGMSPATVRSTLRNARAVLRQLRKGAEQK
jgi:RNA polymerase sigma factor (sigma-70 family)